MHGSFAKFGDFTSGLRFGVQGLFLAVQSSGVFVVIQGSEHLCGEVLSANPPLPLSHPDGPYPGSFLLKGMYHEISTSQKKLWDILGFLSLFKLYMHLLILILLCSFQLFTVYINKLSVADQCRISYCSGTDQNSYLCR